MSFCQFENFIAFLLGNEAERQFRHRMTGDYGLCPFPLVTAADSINLGSWTRPDALH